MKTAFKNAVLDNINKSTGELVVKHNNTSYKLGRYYANDNISMIPHSKYIKHTMLHYLGWSDLDMVKGHPSIAVSMGDSVGTSYNSIKFYVENFDIVAKTLIEFYSTDKEGEERLDNGDIKMLFNMMIYGGGFSTWKNKLAEDEPIYGKVAKKIKNENIMHELAHKYKNECNHISKRIYTDNPSLVRKLKKIGEQEWETKGRLMSYWFQTIENHILYICYQTLVEKGIIKNKRCGLEYDGLCIPPIDFGINKGILIGEINSIIYEKTGLPIKMKFKDYDCFLTDIIEKRKNMIISPEYLKILIKDESSVKKIKDESEGLLEKYFNPNFENIKVIVENCPFVSQIGTEHENNIFSPEKVLIIQAYLGKGKTTAFKRLLSKYERILLLSPRIAFAKFICKEFEGICYLDVDEEMKKNNNLDKFVTSMEGIHKLKGAPDYDLIILDECEDNLGVFASITMKGRQVETFEIFSRLIRNCKKIVMASAFITDKTLNFARSLKMSTCLIRNTSLPPKRVAIEIHDELFNSKLYESLQKGEKPYVVHCSLTKQKEFIAELKGGARENEKIEEIRNNMLIYNSEVDDSQFDTLNDIESSWGKASLVMTTPSITVGNSFSPKIPDFNSVWVAGSPTCIVAQTFQGHMRVRHLKENTMFFSLPTDNVLKFHRNRTDIKFIILSQYDSLTDEKRTVMVDLTRKLLNDKNESDNHGFLQLIERSLTTEYETTPEPLRALLMFNLMEQTLSKKHYKQMFFEFLTLCNYEIQGVKKSTKAEELSADILKKNRILNSIKYSEIEKIGDDEADKIKKLIEKKNATSIEKLQLRRYYFDLRIDLSLSMEDLEFYFKLDESSYNKSKLNNAFFESTKTKEDIVDGVIWNTKKTGAEMGLKLIYPKLQCIREINEKLGIVCSTVRDITISRKKIEEIDEYLLTNRKTIHILFNLKDNSVERDNSTPKNNNVRKNIDLLNKIYDSWSGMKIVSKSNINKEKVTEFETSFSYGIEVPPPPYGITYNKSIEKVCMINLEDVFEIPMAIAEDFIIAEIVEEIPEAIEILIPTKKNYEWCSDSYLENERLGKSQSPPPIIWKKRVKCIITN
jgi:hypothetical protein